MGTVRPEGCGGGACRSRCRGGRSGIRCESVCGLSGGGRVPSWRVRRRWLQNRDGGRLQRRPFLPIRRRGCRRRPLRRRRMVEEDFFDLARGDVFGATDNDVVEASLDIEVPVVIQPSAVVGRKPAVLGQRPVPAKVLRGGLLAADVDLAPLAGGNRLAVRIPDLEFDRWQRSPDGAEPGPRCRVVAGDGGPASDHRVSAQRRSSSFRGGQHQECSKRPTDGSRPDPRACVQPADSSLRRLTTILE